MRCTRLYTDAAGDSRLEEVGIDLREISFSPLTPPMHMSTPQAADRVIFASVPPGWRGERHTAPHRQFFVQLTGVIEVEAAGGQTVRTGPGSVTLIEDTHGSGHITRVIGDVPVTGAFVQLP